MQKLKSELNRREFWQATLAGSIGLGAQAEQKTTGVQGTPINDLRAFSEIELSVAEEYDWLESSGPR